MEYTLPYQNDPYAPAIHLVEPVAAAVYDWLDGQSIAALGAFGNLAVEESVAAHTVLFMLAAVSTHPEWVAAWASRLSVPLKLMHEVHHAVVDAPYD